MPQAGQKIHWKFWISFRKMGITMIVDNVLLTSRKNEDYDYKNEDNNNSE